MRATCLQHCLTFVMFTPIPILTTYFSNLTIPKKCGFVPYSADCGSRSLRSRWLFLSLALLCSCCVCQSPPPGLPACHHECCVSSETNVNLVNKVCWIGVNRAVVLLAMANKMDTGRNGYIIIIVVLIVRPKT